MYYNWAEIVKKLSDEELLEIYRDKNTPLIEKREAAINELIRRKILEKNTVIEEDVYKGEKEEIRLRPLITDELKIKTAQMVLEHYSDSQILSMLKREGIDREKAEKLIKKARCWHKNSRIQFYYAIITTPVWIYVIYKFQSAGEGNYWFIALWVFAGILGVVIHYPKAKKFLDFKKAPFIVKLFAGDCK